jgi:midasin
LQAIDLTVKMTRDEVRIGGFGVKRGSLATDASHFRFEAPSTALNAMRVLRGCQLPKAILLEGSPGVGKTSLVSALAAISGHRLQRINLSDQTDLIDLFGSDLPIEGGQAGEFQWRDAAFLDAMQKGDWVLLDEMNLASQTVLEGLNAVLDHRGTVFISELGRSFVRHPDFRVFAAQNPLQQGGGRKGLPKSFLNRFTKVYLQEHTAEDLLLICRALHPMPVELVETMIAFNEQIRRETMVTRTIGREGSPWEFNLRDLFRWFKLLSTPNGLELSSHPIEYLRMVYLQRFRNDRDREAVLQIFTDIFAIPIDFVRPAPYITPGWFQVGHSLVSRSDTTTADLTIAHVHLELAESVLKSVEMGWLVILAGDSGGGKRSLIRAIAEGAGRTLGEFAMHPGVDTSELLGSFEQQDVGRLSDHAFAAILSLVEQASEQDTAAASLREPLRKARSDLADPRHVGALDAFVQTGQQVLNSLTGHVDVSAAIPILEAVVKAGPNAVGFAWVDGQLLDAIRSGGWFLISNANLCSASVLDRLNSLCETSGVLVMSEKGSSTGSPEVIKPHPDFRLFLTYDPRQGELSRAMRNRGVELYVQPAQSRPIPILTQTSPGIANHASLRSLEALDTVQRNGPSQTSAIANTVASSTVQSTSLISRFGSLEQDRAEIFKISVTTAMSLSSFRQVPSLVQDSQPSFNLVLVRPPNGHLVNSDLAQPIDISLGVNVSITEADVVFRAIQLVLRNHVRGLDVQRWLADPTNNMSILAASAAAVGRAPSRGKPKAGLGLYPFTSLVRGTISQMLTVLLGSGESTIVSVTIFEFF